MDIPVPQCRVCGTKRQRNLIISYTAKKRGVLDAISAYILGNEEQQFLAGKVDKHVICYRCSMLAITDEQKRYIPDLLFGYPKYRYKNQSQKNATMRSKGIE